MRFTTGSPPNSFTSGTTQPPGRFATVALLWMHDYTHCYHFLCLTSSNILFFVGSRTPCATTSACTSVLCDWREEKEPCGQWMRQSTRGGKDRNITGRNRQSHDPVVVRLSYWCHEITQIAHLCVLYKCTVIDVHL